MEIGLEISRYLLPRYGSAKMNLLITDTDSFFRKIHETKTDLHIDMKGSIHWFDTSSYPLCDFLTEIKKPFW